MLRRPVSVPECERPSGSALDERFELNLHECARRNQRTYVEGAIRGLMITECLFVCAHDFAPVALGGKQEPGQNDILDCAAKLPHRGDYAIKNEPRLCVGVAFMQHATILNSRRCADSDQSSAPHCAGIARLSTEPARVFEPLRHAVDANEAPKAGRRSGVSTRQPVTFNRHEAIATCRNYQQDE